MKPLELFTDAGIPPAVLRITQANNIMIDTENLNYLTLEQCAFYQDQGYLHLENVFTDSDLNVMQTAIEKWVTHVINKWLKKGLIDHDYSDLPLDRRYLEAWCAAKVAPVKPVLMQEIAGKELFDFANTPALRKIAQDLTSAPNVQALEAYMCRPTLPNTVWDFDTLWHQDAQCCQEYGLDESMNFVTLWVPFMDITEQNSCLQVEAEYLKKNILHDNASEVPSAYNIADDICSTFKNVTPLPVKRGDIICIQKLTPHNALPNNSENIRWSIDMRFEGQHEAEMHMPKRGFFISHNDPSQLPKNHREALSGLWGRPT